MPGPNPEEKISFESATSSVTRAVDDGIGIAHLTLSSYCGRLCLAPGEHWERREALQFSSHRHRDIHFSIAQSRSRADMDPPRRRVMAELKRAARQCQCPSWSRPPAPAAPLSTKAGRNRRLADVRVLAFLASESTTSICGLPDPNCGLIEVCLQRLSGTLLFSKIATGDTISSMHLVDGVDHSSSPNGLWASSSRSVCPATVQACYRFSFGARNPARAIRRSMFRDEPLLQR